MTLQQKAQHFMYQWNNMDIRCANLVALMQHLGYTDVVEQIKKLSDGGANGN